MSAFDELAADDVDLLTASETVPRRILEEAVRIADRYEAALREIATRPKVERNPDGVDQAAWTMALIAEDALKGAGK